MSYDIYLKDRVSGETIMLPIKHVMTGGTYQADYNPETKTFSPAAIRDAWLNITYNYGRYYYEAAEGDDRFYVEESGEYDNLGIRGIYGKSGSESINMLKDLASRIEMKYKKDGEWINTIRKKTVFKDINGNDVDILKMHFCEEIYVCNLVIYVTLTINQFGKNDLLSTISDAIHFSDPG